jgi:hypothetical protein
LGMSLGLYFLSPLEIEMGLGYASPPPYCHAYLDDLITNNKNLGRIVVLLHRRGEGQRMTKS